LILKNIFILRKNVAIACTGGKRRIRPASRLKKERINTSDGFDTRALLDAGNSVKVLHIFCG
jgi:hypothetical protein